MGKWNPFREVNRSLKAEEIAEELLNNEHFPEEGRRLMLVEHIDERIKDGEIERLNEETGFSDRNPSEATWRIVADKILDKSAEPVHVQIMRDLAEASESVRGDYRAHRKAMVYLYEYERRNGGRS